MEYMVIGFDGKEYGPSNFATLQSWVSEGRIQRDTKLRDFGTGRELTAADVTGLFDAAPAPSLTVPPQPAAYPRAMPNYGVDVKETPGAVLNVVLRCVAAIVFFFVFHGIGVVFAVYAMYYAIRLKSDGSKFGVVAIVLASLTLLAVGIGWAMRMNGAGV